MAYIGTETNRLLKPVYKHTVKFQQDLYIYCKPFMSQAGHYFSLKIARRFFWCYSGDYISVNT